MPTYPRWLASNLQLVSRRSRPNRYHMLPLLLIVQLGQIVPGFAQADTRAALQRASLTAVRTYVPARAAHDDVAIPRNLIVTRPYEQTIAMMRRLSPTFRRQCLRIAGAPHLKVMIGVDASKASGEARAYTTITRDQNGDLLAEVRIREIEHAPELIAHEIEHIIEQLDGVDLGVLAAMDSSGVRKCDCRSTATYETIRAVTMGVQVAREVSEHDR